MLQLIIGTDWTAVRNEILSRIARDVENQQGGRILMVPELISHDTERRLCIAAGSTASRFAEVLSFTRLANRVSDYAHEPVLDCMDAGGRVVAMAAAARQLSSRLKAYAAVETKPEFLTQMVDAVDEFKRCRITPEQLMEASGQAQGTLAQKLEELSLLLGAYDGICQQGKRDPRDREILLLEQLEDGDFAENHVFYIDGFPDYTRQHMAILEHLIRFSPNVTVGINCDTPDSNALAFEKAGETAKTLIQCAKAAGIAVQVYKLDDREDDLGKLCRSLFQGSIPKVSEDKLTVTYAAGAQEEAAAAAEHILKLVRKGYRYRDIAIVCGDLAAYGDTLDLLFDRCHIPLYRSGTEEILQKTVITGVVSALEAVTDGFSRHNVMRYLKGILSPLDGDIRDMVENYAFIWGIQGKRWKQEWTQHPDGLNENWTDGAHRRLKRLNEARALAMEPLMELEKGFTQGNTVADQVRALYAFLERIGFSRRLARLAEEFDAEHDNRSAQILNQLWDILMSALEQLYDVLGDTAWDADVFTRLFTLLLSQYDVGTIPAVLDAVTLGPVSAMRCHAGKHLIVLGAAEGVLPGYGGAAGLLSDQERIALRALGVPLTGGAMEGIQAEFAEIYGCFCGAQESVYISCVDGQASYVWKRLAQMAGAARMAENVPVAALSDRTEAAAFLAARRAEKDAGDLGIAEEYIAIRNKVEHSLGRISRENVENIYGTKLNLSASQIDRQAECRMSYFLKYGLRARERKEAVVDPAEFGTYVHAVLEQTAGKVMELGGFDAVSLEQTMDIAMAASEEYAKNHFADIDSQRIAYLFRRNRRELEMVVEELWRELKAASFRPEDFEMHFGDGGDMAPIEIPNSAMAASLRGFVDRVDIWKEGSNHYFRVVDYKTGKKDFDYCDILNGVGLQMLLYLFAIEQDGKMGSAAGVQYFPARAPLMSLEGSVTEEEASVLRKKEWVRKGLLLAREEVLDAMDPDDWASLSCNRKKDGSLSGDIADREQMKLLRPYIFGYLTRMVENIASGDVTANPYTRGSSHNACAFCPYGAVCHKASVEGRRNYKAVSAQRFWEEIEQEVKHRG